jgi:hypothetical protein
MCWGGGTGRGKNCGSPIERDLIEWKIFLIFFDASNANFKRLFIIY